MSAQLFCSGRGLEIGALSNPAPLDAEVIYADICDREAAKRMLLALEGGPYYDLSTLIEPNIILQAPHYFIPIENDALDFVYSSHALEHTPNVVAALYDQLRVVKPGGVVYFQIPGKRGTYDHRRPATAVSAMIRRFEERLFHFSEIDASELLWGTTGHKHYERKDDDKLRSLLADTGPHHFFVFTPANVLGLIAAISQMFNYELVFFNAGDPANIQVCIRKQGPSTV
jgi:SAM-dependent methyltransferase